VTLFDGKTLNGWRQVNGTAPFTVEEGAIVGTTRTGTPNSFLATERTYSDFVLELEFRQDGAPSNSGVQFRSSSRPEIQQGRVFGYQADLDPSPRNWTGGIYEEQGRGWLYPVSLNPPALQLYRAGTWNQLRIEAVGSNLRTWVNGVPVAHVIDDYLRDGFIALQVHSVEKEEEAGVRTLWRNIRIRETQVQSEPAATTYIRNTRPNNVDDAERMQGWRLLWDGTSANGWRAANGEPFPSRGWLIQGGELILQRKGRGGDLVTEETFSAFELQLEFKLTSGANSGIKYFVEEDWGSPIGLEFQLLDDARHPDAREGLNGNRTLGSLYDITPRKALMTNVGLAPKVGEWQHARIVAHLDNRVEHWLNGVKVLEYVRGSPMFRSQVGLSKFREEPAFGDLGRGRILLQEHGDEVRFRSIKIRGF
jgi:hypothetical protein